MTGSKAYYIWTGCSDVAGVFLSALLFSGCFSQEHRQALLLACYKKSHCHCFGKYLDTFWKGLDFVNCAQRLSRSLPEQGEAEPIPMSQIDLGWTPLWEDPEGIFLVRVRGIAPVVWEIKWQERKISKICILVLVTWLLCWIWQQFQTQYLLKLGTQVHMVSFRKLEFSAKHLKLQPV